MAKVPVDILYGKVPEVSKNWDQRKTLKPPVFLGPMARIAKGIDIGDPRIDALPASAVTCHGGEPRKIGMDPHPEWVDWDSVRRGQAAFLKVIGPSYAALTFALLQGFSIARFAEVLTHNGYAQNAETAFERYRETSFAIVDWMSFPIDEKDSRAQLQLQNVRAMHSFARRRSKKIFDQSKGEGVPLSQFDMAEVLIGFAGVAPEIMSHEFGMTIDRETRRDMCQTWRLIGYHLGILDEYNPCTSLEELEAIVYEWMPYTPLRLNTCRPATFELQRTALEGFGKYTGIGVEFFAGTLHATCDTRDWGTDMDYLERPCLPGMKEVGKKALNMVGSPVVSYILSTNVVRMREQYRLYPVYVKKFLPYLAAFSRFNDSIVWPIVGKTTLLLAEEWKRMVLGFILAILILTRARRLASRFIAF